MGNRGVPAVDTCTQSKSRRSRYEAALGAGGLAGACLSTAAQMLTAYKDECEASYTASWTSELRERFETLGPGLLDALGRLVHDSWW